MAPDQVNNSGINTRLKAEDFSSLKEKYSVFISSNGIENPSSIVSWHRAMTYLKLEDDIRGSREDKLLGLPNFLDYAEHISSKTGAEKEEVFAKLRADYAEAASLGGYPFCILQAGNVALNRVSDFNKLLRGRESVPVELAGIKGFINEKWPSRLFREEMNNSTLLWQLFGDEPATELS